MRIAVDDAIQPVTAEYIARALEVAAANHDQAVLIEMNTPGGLVDSTRQIIEKIEASPVPVIVYVAPTGSRAGSAGIFILEAADVAAMAPGTNAGAAHPVLLFGPVVAKPDDEMNRKIENDSAALMRSVVSKRGRNVELAESAVRESKSFTDQAVSYTHLPLGRKLGVPVDRAGRVLVQPDLSIPGHSEVFVIGDLAALNDDNGKMLPGVAPVAIQQGSWVAETIARDLENQPRRNFRYHDKGSLATIGRAAAVAQFGKFELSGYFAWLAWLFVHILFLIGFRNRLIVMIQWAWSYLTYERGARLITGGDELPGWIQPQMPEMCIRDRIRYWRIRPEPYRS